MNVVTGNEAVHFHFWEYLYQNFRYNVLAMWYQGTVPTQYRKTVPTRYRKTVPTFCCRWYSYSEPSKTFLMMNVQDSVFQLFERYVKFHIF
jgi:hypothetical protein